MKNPLKLQERIVALLRGSSLHIQFPDDRPWTDLELGAVAWVVEDFVTLNADSHECELLSEWIDSYKFYAKSAKGG